MIKSVSNSSLLEMTCLEMLGLTVALVSEGRCITWVKYCWFLQKVGDMPTIVLNRNVGSYLNLPISTFISSSFKERQAHLMSSVHSWVTQEHKNKTVVTGKATQRVLPKRDERQESPNGFCPDPKPWLPGASPAEVQRPQPCRRGLFLFSVGTPCFLSAGKAVYRQENTNAMSCLVFLMKDFFVESFWFCDFTLFCFQYLKEK